MKWDAKIDNAIKKIPDFPKQGMLYYDISSLLLDADAFGYCIDKLVSLYGGREFQAIAPVEARGFLFAAPLAYKLGIPVLLLRKGGKLPRKVTSMSYDLEYGSATVEVHTEDVPQNGNVLIIDDVLATGGTTRAACDLLRQSGAVVTDVFAVIALGFLNFHKKLVDYKVEYFVEYT